MKWTMYSDAGVRMCDPEAPSPVLGSLGNEAADADFFKTLNTEYFKYDNCYADGPAASQNAPNNARTDFVSRFGVMWKELQRAACIKDLWTGKIINEASLSKQVNAHGSLAIRLSNIRRSTAAKPTHTYVSASTGSLSSGADTQSCSGCTSSNKVGNLGGSSNGRVTLFNIRTSKATQTVLFDYFNGNVDYMGGSNERVAAISVNGGTAKTISFPLSGYNWDKDVYKNYGVELSGFSTTGTNTIAISGIGSAYAPDIDRVGVIA